MTETYKKPRRRWRRWVGSVLLVMLLLVLVVPPVWICALRSGPVAPSALMLGQHDERPLFTWTPLAQIPQVMQSAVVLAEDPTFCFHRGFDWDSMNRAITAARAGAKLVGASTITQQVAKNRFLWPSRSWLRKLLEGYVTFWIERLWSKPRIMEVYLNIASWGRGVFGVTAAAQTQYGFPTARQLTPEFAAHLAAELPAPDRLSERLDEAAETRKSVVLYQLADKDLPRLTACLRAG